jgi:hypothetical protein
MHQIIVRATETEEGALWDTLGREGTGRHSSSHLHLVSLQGEERV